MTYYYRTTYLLIASFSTKSTVAGVVRAGISETEKSNGRSRFIWAEPFATEYHNTDDLRKSKRQQHEEKSPRTTRSMFWVGVSYNDSTQRANNNANDGA